MIAEFEDENKRKQKTYCGDFMNMKFIPQEMKITIAPRQQALDLTIKFYPEDIKQPLILVSASDILSNCVIYIVLFLTRNRYDFGYYLVSVIIPEWVYTMVVTVFLYYILLKINQKLENYEKRRAIKFDL